MVLYEGTDHVDQLRCGLAFAKDNLRVATASLPVQIQPGMAQVRDRCTAVADLAGLGGGLLEGQGNRGGL